MATNSSAMAARTNHSNITPSSIATSLHAVIFPVKTAGFCKRYWVGSHEYLKSLFRLIPGVRFRTKFPAI